MTMIEFLTKLDIPEGISLDSIKLSILTFNLIENAVNACRKQVGNDKRFINFNAVLPGQLLLEIENSYEEVHFDENGYPITDQKFSVLIIIWKRVVLACQVFFTAKRGLIPAKDSFLLFLC